MSTIAAGTTSGTALVSTGDTTGALVLQTNGSTTAVTIATNQVVTLAQPLPVGSGGTGATSLSGITVGTATSATTATNLAGGSNGTIPYQSAAGTTQMLAVGSAGQVLQTNGAGAPSWTTPSSGALVYISQGVCNNTSTVSFTGLTAYDMYYVTFSKAFPNYTAAGNLNMVTSVNNGSSYRNDQYKYTIPYGQSSNTSGGYRSSSGTTTVIRLSANSLSSDFANSSISGEITLNLKNGTSYNFQSWGQHTMIDDGGTTMLGGSMFGTRNETAAVNAVRFQFDAGDFLSGTFRLYGIVNS